MLPQNESEFTDLVRDLILTSNASKESKYFMCDVLAGVLYNSESKGELQRHILNVKETLSERLEERREDEYASSDGSILRE